MQSKYPKYKLSNYSIYLLLIVFICLVFDTQAGRCKLPWTGVWLENGQDLNITHNSIGNLGSCVHKSRDLYLLTSDTARGACYRCLITFPVHENVLHYKTTQCIFENSMSLEKCSQLMSADTTMHTLFRKDASPVACPIEAPLNFTYQSNFGVCNSRTSHMNRCSQYERLALHYQACPEIPNREAIVWQMECIASWHSFGQSFFAARIGHRGGEQYRCFILEKSGTSGRIGESADAGCQELTHISAATTTINFRQDSPIQNMCEFPVSIYGETTKHWESMVFGTTHRISRGTWISTVKGRNESVWTCLNRKEIDDRTFAFRTYVAHGCKTGYQCVKVHHRAPHVIHISYGIINLSDDYDDCSEFVVESRDTLIIHGAQQACSIGGKHYAKICQSPLLTVGCTTKYSMQLVRDCSVPEGDEFTCVAHFKHDDSDFIVARDVLSRQLFCMTFVSSRVNFLRVYDRISCDAASIDEALPSLAINFTSSDSCTPSLLTGFLYSAKNSVPSIPVISIFIQFVLIFIFF